MENNPIIEITEQDIKKHGEVYFSSLGDYYAKTIRSANLFMNTSESYELIIKTAKDAYGINLSNEVQYKESYLDNDEYRIDTIIHLCISKVILDSNQSVLLYSDFLVFKALIYGFIEKFVLDKMCSNESEVTLTPEVQFLKIFKIGTESIPKSILSMATKQSEFGLATTIIFDAISNMRSINDGFFSLESYYNYVNEMVGNIRSDLENKGFYGLKEQDLVVYLSMAYKHILPTMDVFYDVGEKSDSISKIMTPDIIKDIIKKMFTMIEENFGFGNIPYIGKRGTEPEGKKE